MVVLHHIQPHPGVVDDIEGKVGEVHILPGHGEVVVVLVVFVVGVLTKALLLRSLQGPVNADEVTLDKLPLEVRHLGDAGGAAELLHHLGGEPLTVAPTRRHGLVGLGLKGSGVGLIGCHADFLLKL